MVEERPKRHHSGPPWQAAALLLALFVAVMTIHGLSIAAEDARDAAEIVDTSPHP